MAEFIALIALLIPSFPRSAKGLTFIIEEEAIE
jgi:hypothetical protein